MSEMPTLDNKVLGYGEKNGIMVIGEYPKEEDLLMQKPFMSREGLLFRKVLKDSGISESKLYFTYLWKTYQDFEYKHQCSYDLFNTELKTINPKFIFVLGAKLFDFLRKMKLNELLYQCPSPAYILNRGKKYQETVVKQLKEIYAKLD